MRRVIMPVYDGDRLVAVQARALFVGQLPKYLGQMAGTQRAVFRADKGFHAASHKLVLTEDMLSVLRQKHAKGLI